MDSRVDSPLWTRCTSRTERSRAGRRSGWTCGSEVEWSALRCDCRDAENGMLTDFDMDMASGGCSLSDVGGHPISEDEREQEIKID
jgi:hypothetical protein